MGKGGKSFSPEKFSLPSPIFIFLPSLLPCRVAAQQPERVAGVAEFGEDAGELGLEQVRLEIGEKGVFPALRAQGARLQLAEIHPRLEQQIQNTRQRAGLVGQREQYRSLVGCGSVRGLGADDHKTRLIRRLILKIIGKDGQTEHRGQALVPDGGAPRLGNRPARGGGGGIAGHKRGFGQVLTQPALALGKQLKKIGMLVVQDQVWNRVTINRAAHKSTRYYIDEMHLLLKEEQTAAYTVEIWKRFRKWGGIPTGITQNVKDLLSSREVENIFENSDFVYMLNQAGGDRQILAKQLGISTHQLSYVTHSGEGEGLLFYGSTILPFVDHFPKNTELYRIMTTKPQELKKEDE